VGALFWGMSSSGAFLSKRPTDRPCARPLAQLNASDDRGIDVVRNKIKMFAQKKATLPPGRHKIVILDEADRSGWQAALVQ
jgi:hypothetical protein